MNQDMKNFLSFAITVKKQNSDEWMNDFVSKLNDLCNNTGEIVQFEYSKEDGQIYLKD